MYGQGPWVLELKSSGSGAEAGPEVGDPRPRPETVEVVAGWGGGPELRVRLSRL